MRVTNLPDVVRGAGLPVIVESGYDTHNHGEMAGIKGVVWHHTGSSSSTAWRVVRDGRSDLPGPLAQMTLERDGTVRVLSSGVCWHAGTGSWPSIGQNNGNAYMLGIECVYNGSDITDAQRRAYPILTAALCRAYDIPVGNVIGHKEWAPGRKPDPGQVDMTDARRAVQALVQGAQPAPSPAPSTTPRRLPSMIERPFPTGDSAHRIIAPTGAASQLVSQAWLSVSVSGTARVQVWCQKYGNPNPTGAAGADKAERDWTLRSGDRAWVELPSGTEMVTVHVTGSTGPGSILIEQKAA